MIRLIGPDWPSKRLVQEILDQQYPIEKNVLISWGVEREGILNGQPRLDGLEQLEAFAQEGLQCPDFTKDILTAHGWVDEGTLVFGRRRIHTKGRDIVGPRHRRWRRSEYWVKVIPEIKQEWRIHIFLGRSIGRGMKVQTAPPWRRMPVRNRTNGWTMVHGEDPPKGLRTLAKGALVAVGYDFGAVDLWVAEDGGMGVFEVNKAPGCDNYTASAYASVIYGWARGGEMR